MQGTCAVCAFVYVTVKSLMYDQGFLLFTAWLASVNTTQLFHLTCTQIATHLHTKTSHTHTRTRMHVNTHIQEYPYDCTEANPHHSRIAEKLNGSFTDGVEVRGSSAHPHYFLTVFCPSSLPLFHPFQYSSPSHSPLPALLSPILVSFSH